VASVSADDVGDVINVHSAEVSDAKVLKMVKRAEVTLELETVEDISYSKCSTRSFEEAIVLVISLPKRLFPLGANFLEHKFNFCFLC